MVLRRFLTIAISLLSVLLIAVFCTNKQNIETVDSRVIEKPQIILDAGHGGLTNTTH